MAGMTLGNSYDVCRRVRSADGWPIAIYEYKPVCEPSGPPVLLCHGAFSRYNIFDLGSGRGLAPFLARKGRHVLSLDLRGRGRSVWGSPMRTMREALGRGWCIDDYILRDMPAALEELLRATGWDHADAVGHSMGGMILLAMAARDPKLPLRRICTLGSAGFGHMAREHATGSRNGKRLDFDAVTKPLRPLMPILPMGTGAKVLSLVSDWVPARHKWAFFNPHNVPLDVQRHYFAEGVSNTSRKKFEEFRTLPDRQHIQRIHKPLLMVAGKADGIVPLWATEYSATQLRHAESRLEVASADRGYCCDYGHGDLLLGSHASAEIFPKILEFFPPSANRQCLAPSEETDGVEQSPKGSPRDAEDNRQCLAPSENDAPKTAIEFKNRDGLKLKGDAYGDPGNRPILFLHGGGQTRHAWGHAAQTLANHGWYAITLDQRGHGESEWAGAGNYRADNFRDDLYDVMGQLEQKPVLVGASLGGIASLLANDYQGDKPAAGLVFVDVTPKMEPKGILRVLGFMSQKPEGYASLEEVADAVAAYLPHRSRPKDLSGLEKNLRRTADGRLHWHWDPELLATWDPANFDVEERLRIYGERCEAATRISVPTLLVRGRMSDVVSEENAQDFLQTCPSAKYVNLRDAGHMVAGDKNDRFTAAVQAFLDEAFKG